MEDKQPSREPSSFVQRLKWHWLNSRLGSWLRGRKISTFDAEGWWRRLRIYLWNRDREDHEE